MSMTINELCVKRAKAWNDAKAYLDAHRREDGLLSPEEVAEYEKLEAKIVRNDSFKRCGILNCGYAVKSSSRFLLLLGDNSS